MPGNSASRCAAITCSSGTKRALSGTATNRGQQRRHLHAREALLAARGVAHDDREVQRQVRDVRERVRGVDRERREHREDAVLEHRGRAGLRSSSSSSSQSANSTPASCERGRDLLGERRAPGGSTSSSTRARIARSCSTWSRPSGEVERTPTASCSFRPDDAHLEELVEVAAEDREELGPFEQRQRGILGEREHAGVEVEHRQLAVEVPGARRSAARHASSYAARSRHRFRPGAARARSVNRPVIGRRPAASYDLAALRTPAPASSRRRSRRSPGSRSRTRSACAATSSSRCRSRARSSSTSASARPGPRCCCTCCSRWRRSRSSRPVLGPFARPHPRRPPPADRGLDGRPGGPVPAHGGQRSTARCSTRSRSRARAVEGPVGRQELARARGRRPTRRARARQLAARDHRGASAARSRAPFAAAILKIGRRAVGAARRRRSCSSLGTIAAFGIPRAKRGRTARDRRRTRARCTRASIVTAGTAMGLLRGVVGFFTFFAAFALKKQHEPAWVFGLVLIGERGRQRRSAPSSRRCCARRSARSGCSRALLVPRAPARVRGARRTAASRSCSPRSRSPAAAACGRGRVRQPPAARRRRAGARARLRPLRDPVPARVGRSAACSRCSSPAAAAAASSSSRSCLLFGGLSYVGRSVAEAPGIDPARNHRRAPSAKASRA